ncbi:toll/interleukin-1 receptor domain-containing protein [Streptomyces sp. NBC_01525]|uniref:toll/interleukin-1 receptor domain-containing protein n=1 Tax=Streptomyces sp. NBC_01525 TaxID=2903893 RepID=UPI00386A938A
MLDDVIAVISGATALASTYFGYVAVRGQIRRRRPPDPVEPPVPEPPVPDPAPGYDVFLSYADADADTARRLADRLRDAGLEVFLDAWIGPGLVASLEKERALLASANGVLLFSRATLADPAIRDEYAALLQRDHSGGRRFVPVLTDDVLLPPFARIRRPLDLRDLGADAFDAQLAALVRAVRPDEAAAPGGGATPRTAP